MKYNRKPLGEKALQNLMVEYIIRGKAIQDLRQRITGAPDAERWDEILLKAEKQAKQRRMAEVSIENLVKLKLRGTGLQYRMEPQKLRMAVFLKLHGNQQMQIALSHKTFMEQIDGVIEAARMINKVMQDAGQIIRMRNAAPHGWHNPEE